jgi:hypothetical protein
MMKCESITGILKWNGAHAMKTSWFIHSQELQTQPSAGKIMAMVFWNLQGISFVDYMPYKTAITGDAYAVML